MSDWTQRHPWRFALERRAMAELFPGFVYSSRKPSWLGVLRVPQYGREFKVAYVYGPRYPDELPSVWVLDPPLPPDTPHVNGDGSICVHPEDAPMDRWAPPVSLALAGAWLFKLCHWQETRVEWA